MEYVEQRNGGYYVAGTRVSLDSVVYAFRRGESPERIAYEFEALTLSQIEGAIAFYLANREMVDVYLVRQRQEFERMRDRRLAIERSRFLRQDGRGAAGPEYCSLLAAHRYSIEFTWSRSSSGDSQISSRSSMARPISTEILTDDDQPRARMTHPKAAAVEFADHGVAIM